MTARRDAAELAFSTRQQEAETALAAVEARRAELDGEAASILGEARAKATEIEAAAGAEADRIVAEARHTADRVRAASEQEVAALAASRDAINAQLVDLRRTLNAFGGAPPVDAVLATEPRAVYETAIAEHGTSDADQTIAVDVDVAAASDAVDVEEPAGDTDVVDAPPVAAPSGALDAMLGEPVESRPHRELRGAARFHR
jgi:hypothetical protein